MFRDLRKQMPSIDSQQLHELYLFPRPSSQYRIFCHTLIIGFCGCFYGIGLAMQRHKSKFLEGNKYLAFGVLAGYTHVQMNEIATGLLIRNFGVDQYWVTNTAAGIVNCALIYTLLGSGFNNAQKRAGSICLMSMFLDFFAQFQRYVYIYKLKEMQHKQ